MERFQDLLHLSENALTNKPDVVIWPEAALPGLPRYQEEFANPISALAHDNKAWLLIGADDAEATPTETNLFQQREPAHQSQTENSPIAIASAVWSFSANIFRSARWLPFIKWFTPITGSYITPGDRAVQFQLSAR